MKTMFYYFVTIIFTIVDAANATAFALIIKEFTNTAVGGRIDDFKRILVLSILFLVWNSFIQFMKESSQGYLIYLKTKKMQSMLIQSLLMKKTNYIEPSEEDKYLSIVSNDINVYQNDYLKSKFKLIHNIVRASSSIYLLLIYSKWIFAVAIIFSMFPLLVSKIFANKLADFKKKASDYKIEQVSFLKEMISGLSIFKSFNVEKLIEDRAFEKIEKVEKANLMSLIFGSLVSSISGLFGTAVFIVVFGVGTYQVIIGAITIGALIGGVQLINNVVYPSIDISNNINMINSTKFIRERFEKLISEKEEEEEISEDIGSFDSIKMENVEYSYNNTNFAVKNINMEFEKNKKYAIVGRSGSGKSTLLKLLLNPKANYKGKININDQSVKNIDNKSYRKLIGVVNQSEFIFDGSIKDNITLFNEYTEEEINMAIKKARVDSILEEKELNLETKINSNTLSGGEKQRISVARCLLRKSKIMLFDEVTSALDNIIAADIEKTIVEMDEVTSIVITHRLNKDYLEEFDKIIVVDGGQIVEQGSFDRLMSEDTLFKSLFILKEWKSKNE